MSVLFTFPGKIGDTLHQWPLVFHWAREQQKKIVVGLEATSLGPLVRLFRNQPCVEDVAMLYGIEHWGVGGQPWDFGFKTADYDKWDAVHHMGFRAMPNKRLTLFQQNVLKVAASHSEIAETPSLVPCASEVKKSKCVIHGTQNSGNLWRLMSECDNLIRRCFEQVVFVGSGVDLTLLEARGLDRFDDRGDFLSLAEFISDAAMVIGCGSSVVALAGAMKVPSIRVPELHIASDIYANLGPGQWNLQRYRDRITAIFEEVERWKPSEMSSTSSLLPT